MFFADRSLSRASVVAGQFAGIATLFAASLALAAAAMALPDPGLLRWLGLLPAAIGLWKLFAPDDKDASRPATASGALGVASVTVASGGDNIGVYTALFANLAPPALLLTGLLFAAMTALWCGTAAALAGHPALAPAIGRHGAKAVPWVLVALGLWILLRG